MPEQARHAIASRYLLIVTNVIAILCLAWVLAGTDWRALAKNVQHLHWGWIAVSVASNVAVYLIQAWRWCLVLAPVAEIPFWQSARAIYVGLFANETLPFKAGEIIRCFLLGRWNKVPMSVTLASALIERIFDGFWLIATLALAVHFTPHVHPFIVRAGLFLTVLVAVCAIFLGLAMYWKEQALDAVVNTPWLNWAHVLIKDLHLIGHSRYLYLALLVSLPYLLLEVLPIYALFRAFGPLSMLSMQVAFVLMVFLRLGSAVPQAPSNIGFFHFAAARTLEMFAVTRGMAYGFSVLLWTVITLPLLVVGFFALGVTEFRISELQQQADSAANNVHR
ncbi:MAG TPA: lysylphosphatidylglycerol synthase transmembrane domain-containing protein [Bryobacteraceae bacterium]|nr:lysylphosphatidylglycerol synthase transmembrane domain-containing protein [Bryobacteraceae bacterium]